MKVLFVLLAVLLVAPAVAQNTKGDRPVDNQRKIRETKGKTVRKKGKASTRDIAGRRLRTKNKSSANPANVGIPQPPTTARRPRRVTDRAASVSIDKRYSSRERRRSDPDRSWQGDISGYKPRKEKQSDPEATGRNVYPQPKTASRHPTARPPFKGYENKTASGKPIVKRVPQRNERAWKGDIKGQPLAPPPSKSGRLNNVYSQKTRYSKYVSKAPSGRDRPFNNREQIALSKRRGSDMSPKRWRSNVITATGQKPFVTPGRKNVYWGKMKRTEKANTRDLTGRPLQKKNFRSAGTGLFGRDTLAFFGRKPHGDMAGRANGRRFITGSEGKGGWLGDIAGYRLRKKTPGGAEKPGTHEYSGFRSITGKYRHNQPVQGKSPGIGAGALAKQLGRTRGGDSGGRFSGSKTGGLWNNNRSPIPGKALPPSAGRAGNFSGTIKGGQRDLADQGSGFTGYIKARKQGKFVGSVKRNGWNNGGASIQGKLLAPGATRAGMFSGRTRGKAEKDFSDQGSGFTGYIKSGKKGSFIGSVNRANWNNGGTAIGGKLLPGSAGRAGNYSGNMKGGQRDYADQGSGFTGYLKAKKKGTFIGSGNRKNWNNGGVAVNGKALPLSAGRAGNFSGNIKGTGEKNYSDQGSGFTGYIKARKPHKFSGSMSGGLWNNDGKSVTRLEIGKAAAGAGTFQGRSKTRGPEKGKLMATPNKLWNNDEKAVTRLETSRDAALAGSFQGRKKTRGPEKGKFTNTPEVLWNNDEKATTQANQTKAGIAAGLYQGRAKAKRSGNNMINPEEKMWNNEGKATTHIELTKAGGKAGLFQGTTKYRKPDKDPDDNIQARLKMKREYTQNPHSVDEATKKLKPELNRKAGNYASGVKVAGKRQQHPHSDDDAIDGVFLSRASARTVDYQGNVKMRKFNVRHGESPDAKFVNQGENNVKEDRTIMTNVKLLWTKIFQKSESQPANLKDKPGKLRYDKGEKGMWND